jgi:hypothetical protein
MLCSKELSGELDQAKHNVHGLREVWLDIVDNNRIDIAFTPPSNSNGDERVEAQHFPGAEEERLQGELPVQETCAHAEVATAEIRENPEIVEEADPSKLGLKLRSYKFN